MPRLPNLLLHTARSLHPDLPLLLRACRDLRSAQNELRWLRQHVLLTFSNSTRRQRHVRDSVFGIRWTEQISRLSYYFRRHSLHSHRPRCLSQEEGLLHRWCRDRSRGMPLQYILGSQPFGTVDVLCRRGVLIPRPETEAYTIRIARLILDSLDGQSGNTSTSVPPRAVEKSSTTRLRILDLCTGTGCIPLLLHAILSTKISHLEIVGVDISPTAIALAKKNLYHNIAQGHLAPIAKSQIRFVQADIFDERNKAISEGEGEGGQGNWDIVISNPPYISPKGFNKNTSRSVRNYEPKIALVPSPSPSGNHTTTTTNLPNSDGNRAEATATAPTDSQIGDSFYPQILKIANQVNARMVLVEVSDLDQAKRVASLGIRKGKEQGQGRWGSKCEIWRDWFDESGEGEEGVGVGVGEDELEQEKEKEKGMRESDEKRQQGENERKEDGKGITKSEIPIRIIGRGNGRSVFFSSSSSSSFSSFSSSSFSFSSSSAP